MLTPSSKRIPWSVLRNRLNCRKGLFVRKPFNADPMKLLLCSADRTQIERFAKILFVGGVPSEIRKSKAEQNATHPTVGAELRIQNDTDYHTAIKLFTESTQPPQSR